MDTEKILIIFNKEDGIQAIPEALDDKLYSEYKVTTCRCVADSIDMLDDGEYSIAIIILDVIDSDRILACREVCRIGSRPAVIALYAGGEDIINVSELINIGVQECLPLEQLSPERLLMTLRTARVRKNRDNAINAQISTLRRQKDELEDILAVAAHNLRGSALTIQGFSQELKSCCFELAQAAERLELPADFCELFRRIHHNEAPEMFGQINSAVFAIDKILKNLEEYNRISKAELVFKQIDMNKLICDVTSINGQVRQGEKIDVRITDLPKCVGDVEKLARAFHCIFDNALKYLEPSRAGKILISGSDGRDRSIYYIEDNGKGIADYNHEVVFAFCHRIDESVCDGEGFGLTMARRIIERHNGKIELESELGVGSRFMVTLPDKRLFV